MSKAAPSFGCEGDDDTEDVEVSVSIRTAGFVPLPAQKESKKSKKAVQSSALFRFTEKVSVIGGKLLNTLGLKNKPLILKSGKILPGSV